MTLVSILATVTTVTGIVMSLGYFAQVAKMLKTKSARDISLIMFLVSAIGTTTWLLYGLTIKNIPLIIVNAVSVVGTYISLVLILKFRNTKLT